MDIPVDASHSPSSRNYMPRYDYSTRPPISEDMEMFFIIQSQKERLRQKDNDIRMLISRIHALEQVLMEHNVCVIPIERWRERMNEELYE